MASLTRLNESHFKDWHRKDAHRPSVRDSCLEEMLTIEGPRVALSQADIDQAYANGVAEGHARALEEHQTALLNHEKSHHTQVLEMIAASVSEQYTPLFDAIKSRETTQVKAAIKALETAFADLLPLTLLTKIQMLLLSAHHSDRTPCKLCVRLNNNDLNTVQSDIDDLVLQEKLGEVNFVSDESLPAGNCQIQWEGGQVSYDPYTPFLQLVAELRDHYAVPKTLFSAQAKEVTSDD